MKLAHRGLWKGNFDFNSKKKLEKFAFILVDRDRRYSISNTSSLKLDMPYEKDRLRQVDDSPNADSVHVEFDINQPRVARRYYFRNPKIDESNRMRKNDFQLKRKL